MANTGEGSSSHTKEIDEQSTPSESDNEETIRSPSKESDNEEPTKHTPSESDDEEPTKQTSSESEDEELIRVSGRERNNVTLNRLESSESESEESKKSTKHISKNEESDKNTPSDSHDEETIRSKANNEDSNGESSSDSDGQEESQKSHKKKSDNEEEDKESSSESDEEKQTGSANKEVDDEEPTRIDTSESDGEAPNRSNKLYDFDIMMAKKKEENSRKRRRRGYEIINDNDDFIADIINQMKDAAEGDAEANRNKQAAIRKLKLLPFVMSQLRKIEMRDAFLDSDVLSAMTEWLAPLPDKSLPHLQVREAMLKTLQDMNLYDVDRIKNSGIGKAVMYLFKHPKETKENKQRAKNLISCWSRPIFQLDSSFTAISREEREQRDLELMNKQRRASRTSDGSPGDGAGPSNSKPKKFKDDNTNAQKPGDKGWIPRARVPAPSMRDYVIRPRSKVDGDVGKNSKRPSNMLEKYMKSQQERRRAGRQQRAINMSIDRG